MKVFVAIKPENSDVAEYGNTGMRISMEKSTMIEW